jgi:hypothetical protein
MENEYKDLLEVEKWEHLLTNPEDERFQIEMESLQSAMSDISSEVIFKCFLLC